MRNQGLFRSALLLFATMGTLSSQAYDLKEIVPAPGPFVLNDTMYIYSPVSKMFVGAGEAWGSQGIVSEAGAAFVAKPSAGSYVLWNNAKNKNLFRSIKDGTVGAGVKCTFVDGGGAGIEEWDIQPVAGKDNVYTIAVPASNASYVAGEYLGISFGHASNWAQTNANGITHGVYFDVAAGDSAEWEFIPLVNYRAFAMKTQLAEQMKISDQMGLNVDAAVAVYNNPDATLQNVKDAIATLLAERSNLASPDNQVDMTAKIVNPNFETNAEGWNTTMSDKRMGLTSGNANGTDIIGKAWECWVGSGGLQGKMFQVVKGLNKGVYRVDMGLFVNMVNPNNNAIDSVQYVYANADKVTVDKNIRTYSVYTTVGDDGLLELGAGQSEPTATWYNLDNVKLYYLGNSLDSYKFQAQHVADAITKAFPDAKYAQTYFDNTIAYSNQLKDAVSQEAVADLLAKMKEARTGLVKSIGLYKLVDEEKVRLDDFVYQYGYDVLDQFLTEMETISADHTMLNEELEAKLTLVRTDEISVAKSSIQKDQEFPFFVNPSFTGASVAGWNLTGSEVPSGAYTGIIDYWNRSGWDMHQTLEGMKPGIWKMTTKGFYRTGNVDQAIAAWNAANGEDKGANMVRSFMAMNDEQVPFVNYINKGVAVKPATGTWKEVDLDGDGIPSYLPDGDDSSADYLAMNDDCLMTVSGLVGTQGIINMHFWNDDVANTQGAEWSVLSKVTLTYQGAEPDDIRPILNNAIAKANNALINPMANTLKSGVQLAVADAMKSAEGTNGMDMIEKYSALKAALNGTAESISLYQDLAVRNEELIDAYDVYQDQASDEAKTVAMALSNEVTDAIKNGTYTTESEIKGKIAQMVDAIFNLKIPSGMASDNQPQDWTVMIKNPTYTDNTNGWTFTNSTVELETNFGVGVAEGWNKNFDAYQDVEGLKPGIYKVSVQGFYRQGEFAEAAKSFQYSYADKLGKLDKLNETAKTDPVPFVYRAKMYANADTISLQNMFFIPENEEDAALMRTAAGQNWATYVDSLTNDLPETYYFSQSRAQAADRFSFVHSNGERFYDNSLYVKVGEDGHLRIGVCLNDFTPTDWVTFTNWALEYYGESSAHQPTAIQEVAVADKNAVQEFYTMDGRKISRLQKGLNIVRTFNADGSCTVRKVLVK